MTMKWIKQPNAGKTWGKLGYVELDNGTRVSVEDEGDTEVTGTSRGNQPMIVTWSVIRTLLLADNDEGIEFAYGCADCWYAAESPRSIFPHRNAHITPEERAARKAAKAGKKTQAVPATAPTLSRRQPAPNTPVERRRRAVSPAPVAAPMPAENGATPAVTGLSDAMDAVRLLMARAERTELLEQQATEAHQRAETAEQELAEYRQLAKKLLGS